MHAIHERVVRINTEQSAKYVADEAARLRYWAKHPTFFACIKCMDGRVNFPSMTQTPIGSVKAFRAIGGKFNIWWPSFLGRVRHWMNGAMSNGSRAFIFVTYHESASDPHLGCAGWAYDAAKARAHAETLRNDLTFVFGDEVTAIVAGIETDRDLLTLHGTAGDVSGDIMIGKTEPEVRAELLKAFPGMSPTILNDLVPFLMGNARRVDELTRHPRELEEKKHNERIIAVGQGFDWLAHDNLALIINDADPNLAESIRVAASLIEKNLSDAPPGDDATICASIPYRQPGIDYRQAVARSNGLRAFAEGIIRETHPALVSSGRIHSMSAVSWEPNKKIEVLETRDGGKFSPS